MAGMPLAENLRRAVEGRALVEHRPQDEFLGIIGTGDGGAIASKVCGPALPLSRG